MMHPAKRPPIEREIDIARHSAASLRALFAQLDAEVGRDMASQLWWAAFGAQDAAET